MRSVLILLSLLLLVTQSFAQQKSLLNRLENKYKEQITPTKKTVGTNAKSSPWKAPSSPFPTMSVKIEMVFPANAKANATMEYYYKGFECASLMSFAQDESGLNRMIMNFKEGKMMMLMQDKKGKKTGMEMNLKSFDWEESVTEEVVDAANSQESLKIKTTNEYKTIEGYKCRKYIYESEDAVSILWITKDINMNYLDYNQAMYQAFSNSKSTQGNAFEQAGMNGMLIQNHMIPKQNKQDECIMTFKNIKLGNVPDAMFSTTGYEVMKMPSFQDMMNNASED
jgi:GLPGLI family protein